MKPHFYTACIFILSATVTFSQSVGIGTTSPDSSAILHLESSTKGLVIPNLTTSQRNLIDDPVQGLLVFDTDKNTIYMHDGNQWLPLLFASSPNTLPIMPVREASDLEENDNLGNSIDIDGDYAIIGAPLDDIDADADQGSAYIFYKGNGAWEEQAKLVINNGVANDHFGVSVGIHGDYAVVGADQMDIGGIDRGNAFVFKRNGTNWVQMARLNAFDGSAGDNFGHAVDIMGDYIVVGAYHADTDGRAFIFHKEGEWTLNQPYQEKLIPSGGDNSLFGWTVSIDGDEVLVGDPYEHFSGDNFRGAAYIFTRSDTNWTQTARLTASDGLDSDQFGWSVSLSGDYAAIGMPKDNSSQGSAYIYFKSSGWTDGQAHQAKIIAPDGNPTDEFGDAVSIFGDHVVVGAHFKMLNGQLWNGQAYLYKRNGTLWPLLRKLEDESGELNGLFGTAVSINGYNILISAVGKNDGKGEIQYLNIE